LIGAAAWTNEPDKKLRRRVGLRRLRSKRTRRTNKEAMPDSPISQKICEMERAFCQASVAARGSEDDKLIRVAITVFTEPTSISGGSVGKTSLWISAHIQPRLNI
jgi:hypothetical protein